MEATTIEISSTTKEFIKAIYKWAKFFAILGFICMGLFMIGGLVMSLALSSNKILFGGMGSIVGVVYALLALLYFFPCLYMLKFANYFKAFLGSNSSGDFGLALQYLKSHYKFVGIITIVLLSLYVLIFIGAIIFGAYAMNHFGTGVQY